MGMNEGEKMHQAKDIALRVAIGMILEEASRYIDPSERDYRQGMQHAAGIVERLVIEGKKRQA